MLNSRNKFEFVSSIVLNGYIVRMILTKVYVIVRILAYNIERKNSTTDMIHTTYNVLSKHNIQMTHYHWNNRYIARIISMVEQYYALFL